MIAIIDYGMGNLRSVQKGLKKRAIRPRSSVASGLVFPSVGAFKNCMYKMIRNRFSGFDDRLVG